MRAYELHATAKQVQRSTGRSSVAAAAYRSGTRLYDERAEAWHDYEGKQGVEHSRIYTPDDAPDWARDRGKLWNAAEAKENRSNSMTAREFEIAFPAEFNAMQRREAGGAMCAELMRRFGCAVDIAYHGPRPTGDDGHNNNHHAHILYTTRGFDEGSKDGWSKNKYRDWSKDKITTADGETTTQAKQTMLELREFTALEMNRIADRDGLEVRTEHLSFEARGIDREPQQHLGPTAAEMERRGKLSDRGKRNRAIAAQEAQVSNDNDRLSNLERQIADIDRAIKREKGRLLAESQDRGLSLARHLEARHAGREADIGAEIQTLQQQLERQGAFQRFWSTVTRRNAHMRAEIAQLQISLDQEKEARGQAKAEIQAQDLARQRVEAEKQEKEKAETAATLRHEMQRAAQERAAEQAEAAQVQTEPQKDAEQQPKQDREDAQRKQAEADTQKQAADQAAAAQKPQTVDDILDRIGHAPDPPGHEHER